jgi:hypothetical protein
MLEAPANFLGGLIGSTYVNPVSAASNYLNDFNGVKVTSTVLGAGAGCSSGANGGCTNNPTMLSLNGPNPSTAHLDAISGILQWHKFIPLTPGNLTNCCTEETIALTQQGVTAGTYQTYLDLALVTPPSGTLYMRVPNLMLKSGTLPACVAPITGNGSGQGGLHFVAGGSGVADTLQACTKDSSNNYAWRSILPTSPAHSILADGRSTLTAGTVTVSNSSASTSAIFQLSNCGAGGTVGVLSVGTVVNGTSFVINSSSATDTSSVCWTITN